MEPTGIFTQRWLVSVTRIGSALFPRSHEGLCASCAFPPLPFAATPPGAGLSGAGLFLTPNKRVYG
jgi:hypothetical protein